MEYIWDKLDHAITSIDNPPQIIGDLRPALLDKWAEILVERLQGVVACS